MTDRVPNEPISTGWSLALATLGTFGAVASSYLMLDATAASSMTTSTPSSIPEAAAPASGVDESPADSTVEQPVTPVQTTTSSTPSSNTLSSNSTAVEPSEPEIDVDCPPLFEVHFRIGSADLEPGTVGPFADPLVEWLSLHPEATLLVEGHADSTGSEEGNLALSFHRAEAVAAALVAEGLPESQLTSRGLGQYQSLVGEPPDSERNRRVTLQVPDHETCPLENPGNN